MIPKSEQQRFRWCVHINESWGKHHKNFWGQTCIPKNYFRKSLKKIFEINEQHPFFSYFFVFFFVWQQFSLADPRPNNRQPVRVTPRQAAVPTPCWCWPSIGTFESDGVGTIWFFHQNVFVCFERCWWYEFRNKGNRGLWKLMGKVRKDLITVCLVYVF